MSQDADRTAEDALLLELAQLGMDVARRMRDAICATTEVEPLVALTTAYHYVSRGVRQSLALRARFAAGTVVTERAAPAASPPQPAAERPDVERPDWNDYERPDWNERFATATEALEPLHPDPDVCRARIRRDLTVVSRTPALAAIPALQAPAATLAGRAALLGGAALRLVNTS